MAEHSYQKHIVLITGAAGYVGAMLCEQFAKRNDVSTIIALDKEPQPELLTSIPNLEWITANTFNRAEWEDRVRKGKPDIVIHAAWQIRELYGQRDTQWNWNIGGSRNIFEYALRTPSVRRIVHFSSAAVYGAYASNSLQYYYTEADPMREDSYSYGAEKRYSEELLRGMCKELGQERTSVLSGSIIRPAAITGPRGRFMRIRFGLQSALSGQLEGDFMYRIIRLLVSFVPATKRWVRQFVHEDDVVDIVAQLAFGESTPGSLETFNLTPPGKPVYAPDMARAVGKRTLPIFPWMARLAYFVFWHATRGKIPTAAGSWRFYSFPILMDGTKLTRMHNYSYQHRSLDAFQYTEGRYESFVPVQERKINN